MGVRYAWCAAVAGLLAVLSGCTGGDETGAVVGPSDGASQSGATSFAVVDDLCRRLDGSALGEAADVTAQIVEKASDSERMVSCALDDVARDNGTTLTLNTLFYGSTEEAVSDVDAGAISRDWFETNLNDVAEVAGWDDGLIGTRYDPNSLQLYAKVREENVTIEIIYYVGLPNIVVDDPDTAMRDAAVELAEQVRRVVVSAG